MADNPSWFHEEFYLKSKLNQLKLTDPDANWTLDSLRQAIADAGLTPFAHFGSYSLAERTSPNPNFNPHEYLEAKLRQLQEIDPGTYTDIDQVADAIRDAGLDLWQHFQEYGWKEGVNPSNSFDIQGYLQSKLDQLQASDPDGDWNMEKMKDAFEDAELDPISHYEGYGKNEPGVEPVEVPEGDRVPADPNPVEPDPVPEPEPEPQPSPITSPTFTVIEDGDVIKFGGTATGDISMSIENDQVVFTRSNIKVSTDIQLSDAVPPTQIDVAETLTVAGSVLHGQGVRFIGTGKVNITDVIINPSEVTSAGAQFASVNVDLSKVLRSNSDDRANAILDTPLIHVNGSEVDFIKASWVYFDGQYYSQWPEDPWANYYNNDLNTAKANLALLYTNYLDKGGDPDPFFHFIAKTAVGEDVQSREQTLHDNILGELTSAALTDRGLLDAYAVRAGAYKDRPWVDGIYANAYGESQKMALRFDYDKGWERPDYIHGFVGKIDDSAVKNNIEMYFGDGNTITNYSIARHEGAGVELALKAKLRGGPEAGVPDEISGDIPIYTVPTGQADSTSATWGPPAKWSFDFSVATGLNGSEQKLDDFDFILSIDVNPSEEVDFIRFKLLKPEESITHEHDAGVGRMWLQLNTEGGYETVGFDYAQKGYDEINAVVSQNSVNIGFPFIEDLLHNEYSFEEGQFNIRLDAYELDTEISLVGNEIQANVSDLQPT